MQLNLSRSYQHFKIANIFILYVCLMSFSGFKKEIVCTIRHWVSLSRSTCYSMFICLNDLCSEFELTLLFDSIISELILFFLTVSLSCKHQKLSKPLTRQCKLSQLLESQSWQLYYLALFIGSKTTYFIFIFSSPPVNILYASCKHIYN